MGGRLSSPVANMSWNNVEGCCQNKEETYISSYQTAPRGEYVLEDNGFFNVSSKGVQSIAAMKRLEEETAKKKREQRNIAEPKRFNGFAYKNKYQENSEKYQVSF